MVEPGFEQVGLFKRFKMILMGCLPGRYIGCHICKRPELVEVEVLFNMAQIVLTYDTLLPL